MGGPQFGERGCSVISARSPATTTMSASAKNLRILRAAALALALFAGGRRGEQRSADRPAARRATPGVGLSLRYQPSPYIGGDKDSDFLPLVIYDSEYFYLESYRAGLKLERDGWRSELFIQRRFEGFASNQVPESMAGMAKRSIGADVGIATQHAWGNGTAYAELLTDASDNSDGSELRLGYRYEAWWSGRMRWRPYVTLSFRDAKLNNYYYGVQPGGGDARAARPTSRARASTSSSACRRPTA